MKKCISVFHYMCVGKNPEPEEGVVNRTSCLRDFDSCCLNIYKMTAVNCGEFMAYCIIDLPSSCHQRYCFGNHLLVFIFNKYTFNLYEAVCIIINWKSNASFRRKNIT
jgi:hypothetical protein